MPAVAKDAGNGRRERTLLDHGRYDRALAWEQVQYGSSRGRRRSAGLACHLLAQDGVHPVLEIPWDVLVAQGACEADALPVRAQESNTVRTVLHMLFQHQNG